MLDRSCQVQRHALSERGDDSYDTPPVAVEALLKELQRIGEPLPHNLWEPFAGRGNIVDVLRAHGHRVIGSDLVDYGRPDFFNRRDFLLEWKLPAGVEAIVSNPPYKNAETMIAHALLLRPRVIGMLLRLAFYESERRTPILEGVGLKRILAFRKRLPMMHRAGWQGRKANSGMAFAWFIWDRDYVGSTMADRISWER
jgi:hypothetical protein